MTNQNKAKTRDEQILEQSYEYELTIPNDFDDVLRSAEDFVEGAKWADQNPSPEVQQIVEALEEANNMYADYFADVDGTAEILARNEELIETYRKVTNEKVKVSKE